MAAYYNEHDLPTAAWLRELVKAELIADGEIDDRSIDVVRPGDLRGFAQCHFFAGIGGWSYALRLAGWDDAEPVWTGSCPCQPFSSAGKGDGEADPRDLWPAWFRLIRECRPAIVFGEQVEAAARGGWLDRLSADLEGEDYAVGASVLGAHSVGAPHIRQRLWFVADAAGGGWTGRSEDQRRQERSHAPRSDSRMERRQERMADPSGEGAARHPREDAGARDTSGVELHDGGEVGAWADVIWLPCRDGKSRPTKPGIFPLASGLPGRVVLLRGAGNSIVPQVAQAFIEAYLDGQRP